MTEKTCTKCGETKAIASFSPNVKGLGGRASHCKACQVVAMTARRKAHPELFAARRLAWYARRGRQYHKAWQAAHPEQRKALQQKRKLRRYGLTPEAFAAMLSAQNGGCASCGGPPDGKWKKFSIDHDHETGIVRGLLCHGCNTALGLTEDSVERLEKLIAYLVRHHAQKRRTA